MQGEGAQPTRNAAQPRETNETDDVTALEVPLADFERFRKSHPATGERIMRNLAQLLADRLIAANAKLNLLAAP